MSEYDVLCIGNAIVDIIAQCDDAFLADNGIIKGAMNLIDPERANLLYSRMGPAIEASGGSAGNTAAGVASLGGRAAFFGKVSSDQLGDIYTPRHPRPGRRLRHHAARRRAADGALDDLRHARRRALDEHLSRRLRRARARGCRGRQGGRRQGHLFRGLSVGSAARQGGDPADRRASPMRPAARSR